MLCLKENERFNWCSSCPWPLSGLCGKAFFVAAKKKKKGKKRIEKRETPMSDN